MLCVCADRLGFSYSDRARILENVQFRLTPGWYGLVGANGMGKTTLARLIAGELRPTTGRLWLEPDNARVIVCQQEVDGLSDDLLQFAHRQDRESCKQRGLLGLQPTSIERWPTLSPGERKRWQMAAALAANPDVLIVDEPTNHLDSDGREYLVKALCRFGGIGIAISHDRELLEILTHATLRIHNAWLDLVPVTYSQARQLWQAATERNAELREQSVTRQQRLQQRIEKANRDKQAAHKNRSARSRMKNIHDHDGSSFAMAGRAANGEASISRRLSVMSAELERLSNQIPEFVVDKTLGRSLFLDYQLAQKPHIVVIDGEDLMAGDQVIVRDVRVSFERDARVHLEGPNGAGKTTLIRALLAHAKAIENHILYLPQEMSPEQIRALKLDALGLPNTERGRIMTMLAALGVDPDRTLASDSLSPGEARKLKLAFGLANHAWALMLDEPTNHLDLPSIERLEQALVAFPGALLIVSHDERFAKSCTNCTWAMRRGRLVK
jgi:ATPase subunit of ABC transporter with duplicated ATPase domains